MTGFSQFDRGVSPRDFDSDESTIPPHCSRCAKTLDGERDLCAKCEWQTGEGRQEGV